MALSAKQKYARTEKAFVTFDKAFGQVEKLWIDDPSLREKINVEPLYDAYRVFQLLREFFSDGKPVEEN